MTKQRTNFDHSLDFHGEGETSPPPANNLPRLDDRAGFRLGDDDFDDQSLSSKGLSLYEDRQVETAKTVSGKKSARLSDIRMERL